MSVESLVEPSIIAKQIASGNDASNAKDAVVLSSLSQGATEDAIVIDDAEKFDENAEKDKDASSISQDNESNNTDTNTNLSGTDSIGTSVAVDDSARWTQLLVLVVGMILMMSLWFSASVALPQFAVTLDLSTFESSLLVASVNMGFILFGLISALAMIADRFSARKVMFVGGAAGCVINAGLLLADHVGFWGLFAFRFTTGMCLALVYAPGMKAASMWFVQYRGLVLGAMVGALTLGSSLPSFIRGVAGEDVKWQYVILASTGLAAVGALSVLLLGRDGPYSTPLKVIRLSAVPDLLKTLSLFLVLMAYTAHSFELYALWAWASQFYFILMENSSLSTANLFAFMTIAMGSIGSVLGGYFADRVGRTAVCAVCTICSATVSIAIGPAAVATQSEPLVWALAFLWGLTVVADSAQYSAMISELCPADLVGTALTLQLSSGYSATVVSILVLPTIANSTILTWEWSYAVAGVVSYLGLFMLLWLRYLPESEKICGGKK